MQRHFTNNENNVMHYRSVDLNTSSDPYNGSGPGSYPPFMEPADDERDKERDREQRDDWGDDGDNNDFSLIGEEDFPLQVRNLCVCPVLSCSVLSYPILSCFARILFPLPSFSISLTFLFLSI